MPTGNFLGKIHKGCLHKRMGWFYFQQKPESVGLINYGFMYFVNQHTQKNGPH